MGIHDDAVQPQGRTTEVSRQRKNNGDGRDDETIYHGHMEGNEPSKTEPEGANASVILATILKGKADGEEKGRACLNGAPQWAYIPKEDAASPMVPTESTFITGAIAASERMKVRCYNVPSAFVNTNVDKDMLMVVKRELAEMMIQIAPQVYRKYLTVDKKRTMLLYVKLQKAPYRLHSGQNGAILSAIHTKWHSKLHQLRFFC
jgi:hypothetical protein